MRGAQQLAVTRKGSLFLIVAVVLLIVTLIGSRSSVEAQQEPEETPTEPSPQASGDAEFVPGEIIVKRAAGTSESELEELNQRNNASTEEEIEGTRLEVVDLPRDLPVEQAVQEYEDSPVVEYAEPNFLVYPTRTPNDPRYPDQWALNNTGQTGGTRDADIDAPEAWEQETGDPNTLVAVIDSGVQASHPDLQGNIWNNPDETRNGVDDDNNGLVDDTQGWDFFNGDRTVYDGPEADDHGTHVAGTVAATGDNNNGVTGVSWQADIMPLKFIGVRDDGSESGDVADAIDALNYAVDQGADISNNSWGFISDTQPQALCDAIANTDSQGHLFVVAAGNGGADGVGDNNDVDPTHYPASCPANNIISVAATNDQDQLAGFSNFGNNTVDLGAPGVGILSTLPEGGYGQFSGTSMASPHVAGTAALLKSQNPSLSDEEMRSIIFQSVDQKQSLDNTVTGGRLNAAAALGVRPTELTLIARPGITVFRAPTSLSGRLTDDDGTPIGGQTISLSRRPAGSNSFNNFAEVTTEADGTFDLDGVRPTQRTYYRASFNGSNQDSLARATSRGERVRVRVRVTLRTDGSRLKLGNRRGMGGIVRPNHSRGPVDIIIKRNGKFLKKERVRLNAKSRYRFVYRPRRAGNYAFFASFRGDKDHLGFRSRQKGFRVVR